MGGNTRGLTARSGTLIEARSDNVTNGSDAVTMHIKDTAEKSLDRFASPVTRIDVHVGDANGARCGADDKPGTMEAHPSGRKPVAVRADTTTLDGAIRDAIHKIKTYMKRDVSH